MHYMNQEGRMGRTGSGRRNKAVAARLVGAAAAGMFMATPLVRAAVYDFDPQENNSPSDGSNVWDTGSGNAASDWFMPGTLFDTTWSDSTADTAVFGAGGVAGTVTVSPGVNVGVIQFNPVSSGSYLLTGGSLNLGSTAPVISGTITTAAGVTPTIASTINGVNAVFNAPGTLTLTGANTFTNATGSNIGASVATGTVVMGGGVTETFNGELAVGSGSSPAGSTGSPNVATLTINSGTTANATNQNVGLGNIDNNGSATAAQSLFMNVNGTVKTTGLLFSEYQTAQNTTATLNVNSGGSVTASTFGFGQSAGTTTIINVASGATLNTTSTGAGDYLGEAAGTTTTLINNGTVTTDYTIYTNQNGGTNTGVTTITNNGTLNVSNGGTGFYNLRLGGNTTINNSGTLNASGLFFGNAGGAFGTEALNLTGGTMTLAAQSSLNSVSSGTGTVNVAISGPNTVFTDPGYFYLTLIAGQTTTVTQSGGTFNAGSGGGTNGLFFNTGLATYTLNGGVLSADAVGTSGTPTAGSTFVFNGGTLQAQTTGGQFGGGFFDPPSAQVGPSGGTFDTNSNPNTLASTTGITTATGLGATDGGITKIGVGKLQMNGLSTYTGGTTIRAGTLIDGNATEGVGTGNVTVAANSAAGATFQMNAATDLTATQSIILTDFTGMPNSALLNLSYTGSDLVMALVDDGTSLPAGIYGAPGSSTYMGLVVTPEAFISGGGYLTVAAVPEPASVGLLGLAAVGVLGRRRRIVSVDQ